MVYFTISLANDKIREHPVCDLFILIPSITFNKEAPWKLIKGVTVLNIPSTFDHTVLRICTTNVSISFFIWVDYRVTSDSWMHR